MEHQFFIRQQNLKLYRSLVAASEAAAAKADARQEKLLAATALGDIWTIKPEGRMYPFGPVGPRIDPGPYFFVARTVCSWPN